MSSRVVDAQKTRGQLIAELSALRQRISEQYFEQAAETARASGPEQQACTRLLEDVPAALVVLDRRGCVVTWNRACERLFGWTAHEVHGMPLPIIPADEWGPFERSLAQQLEGMTLENAPRRLTCKDSTEIEASVSTSPLHSPSGEVVGLAGLVSAIKPGPERAAKREPSQPRTLPAIEEAAEGICVVDAADRVLYVNGTLARMLGEDVDALVGRSLDEFVMAADAPARQRSIARRRAGIVDRQELWLCRTDGQRSRVLVHSSPLLNEEQGYRGAVEIIFDLGVGRGERGEAGGTDGVSVQRAAAEMMEARLQAGGAITDATPALLYIVELAERRLIYVNRRSERFFGLSSEAIRNQGPAFFQSHLHPRHIDCWDTKATRFEDVGEGDVVECAVQIRDHTGAYRWLHCYEVVFARTADGRPQRVLGAAIDVTEQRAAERALAEREALYRLLTEHATDLISRQTLEGRYLYVSPSARVLLGYDPQALVGVLSHELVHAEDREAVAAVFERVSATGGTETFTVRWRHANGSYRWFESVLHAIADPHSGDLIELHCASRDVTERREAEQALRLVQSVVEQIDEAVLVTDTDIEPPGPRIVYANPAFERMTGYKQEEVLGQSPRILQGPKTSEQTLEALHGALTRGEPFEGEALNYRKDGSEFEMYWHITPLREAGGPITHWVAIQRDITEQKRQERLVRQHESDLAHVARLSTMGEMASGLAHELNQPLAAISNYVQGCLHRLGEPTPDTRDIEGAMHQVSRQAERAGQIIRRLRNFVDKREPTRAHVDINATIRDALALAEPVLKQTTVRLTLELDTSLPHIPLDSIQIEQVVLNIVRNAVEAMADNEEDERHLEIVSRFADGDAVLVTISDTGPGMSNDQLDHIFDPFFTTKGSGMGMGLNISQSIVQAHQGRLWASRNPKRGMTFHLLLPITEPQ